MHKNIIVYGPPASGKTSNAAKLVKHFGLVRHVELEETPGKDWALAEGSGSLILTNITPPANLRRTLSIEVALEMLYRSKPGYPF